MKVTSHLVMFRRFSRRRRRRRRRRHHHHHHHQCYKVASKILTTQKHVHLPSIKEDYKSVKLDVK